MEKLIAGLLVEAAEHEKHTLRFHGQPPETARAFLDRGYTSIKKVARVRAGVDKRAELFVARLQDYSLPSLDNIVAIPTARSITRSYPVRHRGPTPGPVPVLNALWTTWKYELGQAPSSADCLLMMQE